MAVAIMCAINVVWSLATVIASRPRSDIWMWYCLGLFSILHVAVICASAKLNALTRPAFSLAEIISASYCLSIAKLLCVASSAVASVAIPFLMRGDWDYNFAYNLMGELIGLVACFFSMLFASTCLPNHQRAARSLALQRRDFAVYLLLSDELPWEPMMSVAYSKLRRSLGLPSLPGRQVAAEAAASSPSVAFPELSTFDSTELSDVLPLDEGGYKEAVAAVWRNRSVVKLTWHSR